MKSPCSRTVSLRGATALAALCCGLLFVPAAHAQDNNAVITVGLGGEYSDNIRREPTNEESDTVVTASVNADVQRTSRRFDLGLETDLAYDHYMEDSYDGELRGNALLDFEAQIVRQRFSWYVEDSFGQLRLTPLAPDTPDNRENYNVFSTGPRFTQPFGQRWRLILEGLYEVESYEESPLGATRTGGDLSLRHDLTPRQNLQLTASRRSTEYDEGANFEDYDIDEFFLRWSATGAKTELNVEVGESRTRVGDRDDNRALIRLDVQRKVGSFGNLTLLASSQQASTADAFRVVQGGGELQGGAPPLSPVGEPFDFDYLGLRYELGGRRFNGSVQVSTERDRYDFATSSDRDRDAVRGSLQWLLTPAWTLGADVDYAREDYVETGGKFKEIAYSVDVSVHLTRSLSLLIGATTTNRDGGAFTSPYDENRVRILLTHTTGRAR